MEAAGVVRSVRPAAITNPMPKTNNSTLIKKSQ
jgi:hypothetical protein